MNFLCISVAIPTPGQAKLVDSALPLSLTFIDFLTEETTVPPTKSGLPQYTASAAVSASVAACS